MVRETIHNFLFVKRRLLLLKVLFRALDQLKDIEGGKLRIRNDTVWQMVWDTNSMLVNDLYSLRDHLTRFKVFQPTPDPNHPGALISLPRIKKDTEPFDRDQNLFRAHPPSPWLTG